MSVERRPGSLSGMPDDRLGTVAVSLVVAELQWAPDVAPAVMDRISRDAVAYPEQFDRRPPPPPPPMAPPPTGRSAKRTLGRVAVFAVIFAVVVALVVFVATASAASADADGGLSTTVISTPDGSAGQSDAWSLVQHPTASVLIGAIDGRLRPTAEDVVGVLRSVHYPDRSYHLATEAS